MKVVPFNFFPGEYTDRIELTSELLYRLLPKEIPTTSLLSIDNKIISSQILNS